MVVVKNVTITELARGVVTLVAELSKTLSVVTPTGGVVTTVPPPVTPDGGIPTRTESTVGIRAVAVSVFVGSLSGRVTGGVPSAEVT